MTQQITMFCCSSSKSIATANVISAPASSTPRKDDGIDSGLKVQPPTDDIRPAPVDGFLAATLMSSLPAHGIVEFNVHPSVPVAIVMKHGSLAGAIYAVCPHKEANLACGDIEESASGCAVKCPRHRKKFPGGLNFDTSTGKNWTGPGPTCTHEEYNADWSVPVFAVRTSRDVSGREWLLVSEEPEVGELPAHARGAINSSSSHGGGGRKSVAKAKQAALMDALGDGDGSFIVPSVHVLQRHTSAGDGEGAALAAAGAGVEGKRQGKGARAWAAWTITAVQQINHDTRLYSLAVQPGQAGPWSGAGPSPTTPTTPTTPAAVDPHSWHVSLTLQGTTGGTSREYTPVSSWEEYQQGKLDLLIKIYPTGKLTSALSALSPGATLRVSEPETTLNTPHLLPSTVGGSYIFEGQASGGGAAVSITHAPGQAGPAPLLAAAGAGWGDTTARGESSRVPVGPGTAIALVAGGTGVTPILQLARWALARGVPPSTRPEQVYILTSSKRKEDVLCRQELAALVQSAQGRCRVLHTVTREGTEPTATEEERGGSVLFSTGRIGSRMLTRLLPSPLPPIARVVISGPQGMFATVRAAFQEAGLANGEDIMVELEA